MAQEQTGWLYDLIRSVGLDQAKNIIAQHVLLGCHNQVNLSELKTDIHKRNRLFGFESCLCQLMLKVFDCSYLEYLGIFHHFTSDSIIITCIIGHIGPYPWHLENYSCHYHVQCCRIDFGNRSCKNWQREQQVSCHLFVAKDTTYSRRKHTHQRHSMLAREYRKHIEHVVTGLYQLTRTTVLAKCETA